MQINTEKITRFEVIDKQGRVYLAYFNQGELDLSIQDSGLTLKAFIKRK